MVALISDCPSTKPHEDLFGHAPFAECLANSIFAYPNNDGLVVALYGPWGAGKSTVLNYVNHYLEQRGDDEKPVIVHFNPWWFSGQENLARVFLGQLQAVLPEKNKKFKKIGDLLGDFAEGVGGLIDLSGATGGLAAKFGKALATLTKQKPKDVPAIKSKISKILLDASTKILIIIDDIDRLTPEETRQLFTVIKALADFPNVIYLLAFDREVASQAIEQQSGLPGERYLEKIIQVPFELPPIDRTALRAALLKRLDGIIGEVSNDLFDQTYWANVFHDGLDPLFKVPRDIVRFTNTLHITYQAVREEVNSVDFIALEAIRVFLPNLYDVIRTNQEWFSGHSRDTRYDTEQAAKQAFHEQWQKSLPNELRESTRALLERIFPKIGSAGYGSDWLQEWRKNARACHPDFFSIYFRLTLPSDGVSRSEVKKLLALASNPSDLAGVLIKASTEKRADGVCKVRVLLERILDHIESDFSTSDIKVFLNVLLDVGDSLLEVDMKNTFDFGNELRIYWVVDALLKRISTDERNEALRLAFQAGHAISVQRYFITLQLDILSKPEKEGFKAHINSIELEELKSIWLAQLKTKINDDDILHNNRFPALLWAWSEWGHPTEVFTWCELFTTSDEKLSLFISKFISYTRSHAMGDRAYRYIPRLNPRNLEKYIDIAVCADRLNAMQSSKTVPEFAKEAVSQFIKEFEIIKKGGNPDGYGVLGD